jgi:hypothetical protein
MDFMKLKTLNEEALAINRNLNQEVEKVRT